MRQCHGSPVGSRDTAAPRHRYCPAIESREDRLWAMVGITFRPRSQGLTTYWRVRRDSSFRLHIHRKQIQPGPLCVPAGAANLALFTHHATQARPEVQKVSPLYYGARVVEGALISY